jgi:DNA-binding CsgD family transcriptional regulator
LEARSRQAAQSTLEGHSRRRRDARSRPEGHSRRRRTTPRNNRHSHRHRSHNPGEGLRCNHGRLACARTQETFVLHHAIRNLASAGTVMDLYVSRSDGRRPLTVHIMPIASLTAWRGFAPPAAVAAAFVIDPLNCTATVDGFAAAYGLTASESRVLREIISCEGLVQAARKLRIAVPTAKTHLQHIFSKTSTSSQVELVQLLMKSSLQTKRPVE